MEVPKGPFSGFFYYITLCLFYTLSESLCMPYIKRFELPIRALPCLYCTSAACMSKETISSLDYDCRMSWSGMGSHHHTWHAVAEEDQSTAATVWRLPAWDARQAEEGEQSSLWAFSVDLVSLNTRLWETTSLILSKGLSSSDLSSVLTLLKKLTIVC